MYLISQRVDKYNKAVRHNKVGKVKKPLTTSKANTCDNWGVESIGDFENFLLKIGFFQ